MNGENKTLLNNIGNLLSERFLALEHKNFRYFLAGQSISLVGTWMQRTAQQWLVYSLTNSGISVGITGSVPICSHVVILIVCRSICRQVS